MTTPLPVKIAVLGDSLSTDAVDYGAGPVRAWTVRLDPAKVTVVRNLSGGGGTVGRYLRGCPREFPCDDHRAGSWLQPGDLSAVGPQVVVVHLQGGDYYTSVGAQSYLADLLGLRDAIRAQVPTARLLYVQQPDLPQSTGYAGVQYPTTTAWSLADYADALRLAVKSSSNARFVDLGPLFRESGSWRTPDGVHLTQTGQDRQAAALTSALTGP